MISHAAVLCGFGEAAVGSPKQAVWRDEGGAEEHGVDEADAAVHERVGVDEIQGFLVGVLRASGISARNSHDRFALTHAQAAQSLRV